MRCPYCASMENRVIDSRMAREGRSIRRRRHCEGCQERFTTYEVIEETLADVEKRNGVTEPFSAEKLLRSLRLACKKRPVPLNALTEFVEKLEGRISARPRRTIRSLEIGDAVLAFLRDVDPVAYVRYASVYRSFASIAEFTRELDTFHTALPLSDPDPTDGEDGALIAPSEPEVRPGPDVADADTGAP